MQNTLRCLCFLFSIFAFSPFLTLEVQAQDATASTEVTIEKKAKNGDETTTESATQILQNLERLAKNPDQSQQIKGKYDGVTNKTRGFIAQVASLKDDSFKISTPDGEEFFIAPDKSTTIVKKGESTTGEDVTLADWFAIDDWVVLIGVQNGEIFQPRRIMISSESLAPVTNFVTRGIIKDSRANKLDIELIGTEGTIQTFPIDKSSNLVNQANETITYKDLPAETSVLLVGTEKDGKKTLQTLRLL